MLCSTCYSCWASSHQHICMQVRDTTEHLGCQRARLLMRQCPQQAAVGLWGTRWPSDGWRTDLRAAVPERSARLTCPCSIKRPGGIGPRGQEQHARHSEERCAELQHCVLSRSRRSTLVPRCLRMKVGHGASYIVLLRGSFRQLTFGYQYRYRYLRYYISDIIRKGNQHR